MTKVLMGTGIKLIITAGTLRELHSKLIELADEVRPQPVDANINVCNEDPVKVIDKAAEDFDPVLPPFHKEPVEKPVEALDDLIKKNPPGESIPHNHFPASQVGSSTLDAAGMPWDARIHSASKATTKDGTWRYRRNVNEKAIDQVEKELKSRVNVAPVITTSAPVNDPFAGLSPQQVQAQPMVQPVLNPFMQVVQPTPQAPTQPVATYENIPTPTGTKYVHTVDSFHQNLIPIMASLINEKVISQDYVQQLKGYFGVNEIWEIFGHKDKVTELFENFVANNIITRRLNV